MGQGEAASSAAGEAPAGRGVDVWMLVGDGGGTGVVMMIGRGGATGVGLDGAVARTKTAPGGTAVAGVRVPQPARTSHIKRSAAQRARAVLLRESTKLEASAFLGNLNSLAGQFFRLTHKRVDLG